MITIEPSTLAERAHDHIEVRGVRENNLKGVSLDIPKRQLTVFTGVSGSGKSSLVFGTIAAESQRLIKRRGHRLRDLPRQALHRRSAGLPAAGQGHQPGPRPVGGRRPRVLHRAVGAVDAPVADRRRAGLPVAGLTTLSGGERQRLKLAIQMAGPTAVYVLDEPTTGLHMADVDNLIGLLDHLVDQGRTVIVIEHNLDIVARADWVIDLGPGAGHDGGTVVFEGPPAALAAVEKSLTGLHLRR